MMPYKPMLFFLLPLLMVISESGFSQTNADPEFKKGWLLLAKLNNGFSSNFRATTPDIYIGGLALNPQVTVMPHRLRLGANAGVVYTGKQVSGIFGPMAALKLKTIGTKYFGSYANFQLLAEAGWGTRNQRLAGGGFALEALTHLHIGLTALRDYRLNTWWFQSTIAVKINKMKTKKDEYEY